MCTNIMWSEKKYWHWNEKEEKKKNSVVVKKSICKIQKKKEKRGKGRAESRAEPRKRSIYDASSKKDRHTQHRYGQTDRGTFIL